MDGVETLVPLPKSPSTGTATHPNKAEARRFLVLFFFGILCFFILLTLFILKPDKFVWYGLMGPVYYFLLLFLGLSFGAALVGLLGSQAAYTGNQFGGTLKMSGAAVISLLIPLVGYYLFPPSSNFPLTVFVHGQGGLQDVVLKNSGYVVLDLGPDRRRERIGEKGQATFPGIPSNFRGKQVNVGVDAPGFSTNGSDQTLKLDGEAVYLEVQRRPGRVSGRVCDEDGVPVPNANISLVDLTTTTNSNGYFELELSPDKLSSSRRLSAVAPHFATWTNDIELDSNEVAITLRRMN